MDPPAPERFCRVGRRTADGRIGNTVEAFDEPTRQKRSALWVAPRRPPAASPRLSDVPHRATRGSWRIGSPQRNAGWVDLITSCSNARLARKDPGSKDFRGKSGRIDKCWMTSGQIPTAGAY
jgi:hypothetical protein